MCLSFLDTVGHDKVVNDGMIRVECANLGHSFTWSRIWITITMKMQVCAHYLDLKTMILQVDFKMAFLFVPL
jgi:hypothetical protein